MKPSPVQLLQLTFKRVHVEVDAEHAPSEPPNPLTNVFVFDGVNITTEFGLGEIDLNHERGPLYGIALRVLIDNKAIGTEQPDQRFSPYRIDLEAEGAILIPKGAAALGPPEDLASVNGAALLWSAIKEQVLNLTSRMSVGQVMLPTVHFHDLKKGPVISLPNQDAVAADGKPVARKRASSKQIR